MNYFSVNSDVWLRRNLMKNYVMCWKELCDDWCVRFIEKQVYDPGGDVVSRNIRLQCFIIWVCKGTAITSFVLETIVFGEEFTAILLAYDRGKVNFILSDVGSNQFRSIENQKLFIAPSMPWDRGKFKLGGSIMIFYPGGIHCPKLHVFCWRHNKLLKLIFASLGVELEQDSITLLVIGGGFVIFNPG